MHHNHYRPHSSSSSSSSSLARHPSAHDSVPIIKGNVLEAIYWAKDWKSKISSETQDKMTSKMNQENQLMVFVNRNTITIHRWSLAVAGAFVDSFPQDPSNFLYPEITQENAERIIQKLVLASVKNFRKQVFRYLKPHEVPGPPYLIPYYVEHPETVTREKPIFLQTFASSNPIGESKMSAPATTASLSSLLVSEMPTSTSPSLSSLLVSDTPTSTSPSLSSLLVSDTPTSTSPSLSSVATVSTPTSTSISSLLSSSSTTVSTTPTSPDHSALFTRKRTREEEKSNSVESKLSETSIPIIISYGQAILLLIDYYQNEVPIDQSKINKLKKIYLSGPEKNSAKEEKKSTFEELDSLISEGRTRGIFSHYIISDAYEVINEDASRRTFENALAIETLSQSLKDLPLAGLNKQFALLYEYIQHNKTYQTIMDNVNYCLTNPSYNYEAFANPSAYTEYGQVLFQLQSSTYYTRFDETEKLKMALIMKINLASFILEKIGRMPLRDLYCSEEFYNERGRVAKTDQNHVKAQSVGLYRSYHASSGESLDQRNSYYKKVAPGKWILATSTHDSLWTNRTNKNFPFVRCADRFNFERGALWIKNHFSTLVHPFSCSISGTMLFQLKVFKFLEKQDSFLFNDIKNLSTFIKCFTSLHLYSLGGHSYNEFISVLNLKPIQKAFTPCIRSESSSSFHLTQFSDMNMDTLLRLGNEIAFDAAIQEAINYNNLALSKSKMHSQLTRSSFFSKTSVKEKTEGIKKIKGMD